MFVDQSGSLGGGDVRVVRTLLDGDTVVEYLPALVAVDSVMFDPRNGVVFKSARIEFDKPLPQTDVWGTSGGGFAAEWSLLLISRDAGDDV